MIDAGDNVEKAKNAAQRMVAQEPDLVGCTGAWLSSFTLAVTEVTERAELPWLTLSYSDQITGRGFHYVFQTSPTGERAGGAGAADDPRAGADGHRPRPKTVAIIMDNTAASVSFAKPMREGGLAKAGIKLVVDETFTPPLSDATPLVQKVRSARPDMLFCCRPRVSDDKLLLEKLNEFGLGRGRCRSCATALTWPRRSCSPRSARRCIEGVMTVTLANWGIKGQEQLVAEFKKRTGEPWMTQDSLSPYGDMWILKEALENAPGVGRSQEGCGGDPRDGHDRRSRALLSGRTPQVRRQRTARGRRLVIVQWQNGVPETVFPLSAAVAKAVWPAK